MDEKQDAETKISINLHYYNLIAKLKPSELQRP